jgi:hypothetical protein
MAGRLPYIGQVLMMDARVLQPPPRYVPNRAALFAHAFAAGNTATPASSVSD